MKRMAVLLFVSCLALLVGAGASAQETIALRFLCFNDGNECEVYQDLLARFSSANPMITITIEAVDEGELAARLSQQIEAGMPPDIARIADFAAHSDHYLDLRPQLGEALDAAFNHEYFGALPGFPDALAMVAPFVNLSLFAQAEVAVPEEGASWDEWLAALDEVVAATDAAYALSVDNKDHRFLGPAMSLGAEFIDEDGGLTLPDDDGLRALLQILHGLMDDGKTPADALLGTGKSQDYFVRGEAVMYICGSWKVEEVADQVGDDFEWAIVANPAGPGGGTGVTQTTALVAFAQTEHEAAVAKVFEYLLQPAIYAEFSARTLTIPAHNQVMASSIDYDAEDATVADALNAFAREVPKLQVQAIALPLHPMAPHYYEASNRTLRGFFAGEYTLDEALDHLKAALVEAGDA